ncbi:hypothetical protein H5P28_03890 [Ruficoccus amylovorans]|uniref:PEP-CTERM sorting domain-containing protein n=1 Tax=Ruficoccus amylovorans TaxID=1804625 RepID=A0A842HCX3_9BACT|nr:SGNH/GDSL hydrolase family protein [Ruficoccus amylovorans]MBC2593394.1 hypothetical protein [Ruficoccus amylovorans]
MNTFRFVVLAFLLSALGAWGQSVLFVGNSFTYVPKEYGAGTVTDLHDSNIGGIPAIFKKLAQEGGKDPQVSSELSGGKTLEWHYVNHADKIAQPWDIVVLQEYSTRPLVSPSGGGNGTNVEAFRAYAKKLIDLVREENPEVDIYLYETWARPNLVEKGLFAKLGDMQDELRTAYSGAAEEFEVEGWFPVGDAFMEAVDRGVSDDPSTPESEGPIRLWGHDKYHQNNYGAYLSALVMYRTIYQADPRELPVGEDSAADGLDLKPEIAQALQQVAYDIVPLDGQP